MTNDCHFSPCRKYRYRLAHTFEEPGQLFALGKGNAVWIGLNPSKADEQQLDPTLRRIREFSRAFGFSGFVMLNLFAWRETDSELLPAVAEPIGPENDGVILEEAAKAPYVICAWGTMGGDRGRKVWELLRAAGIATRTLRYTKGGHPEHPLYLPKKLKPQEFLYCASA